MPDRKLIPAATPLAAPTLAGCGSEPTKQEIGTVGGGIVGSSLTAGSTAGMVAGAGAYVGNRIGKQLDH